ncbi:hypothetical protein Taro_031075, partial [Colocasia esculenta]|nr:hypothetical protein [Colocasia esculenta]
GLSSFLHRKHALRKQLGPSTPTGEQHGEAAGLLGRNVDLKISDAYYLDVTSASVVSVVLHSSLTAGLWVTSQAAAVVPFSSTNVAVSGTINNAVANMVILNPSKNLLVGNGWTLASICFVRLVFSRATIGILSDNKRSQVANFSCKCSTE